jgi:hypothetical protein
MDKLKDIDKMTKEEIIAEIVDNQTRALHYLSEHDIQHILLDLRVGEYKRQLSEQLGHHQEPSFSRSEFPSDGDSNALIDSLHQRGFL